ncbi:MAG: DUF2141 domain-containing protein [Bacteroidetes bacterium]|nr:DUF2141 domain-containing protein [Bacteroidota bacterium]
MKTSLMFLLGVMLTSWTTKSTSTWRLTVEILGVAQSQGDLLVALFAEGSASGFPENTKMIYAYKLANPKIPNTVIQFDALPAGRYAYSVLHDFNGNQFTDKNLVGYPKEPYAFSNNVRPWYKAPAFDECAFELKSDTRHRVTLLN